MRRPYARGAGAIGDVGGGGRVCPRRVPQDEGGGREGGCSTGGAESSVREEEVRRWPAGSTKRFGVLPVDVLTTASSATASTTARTEVTKASRMRTATVSVGGGGFGRLLTYISSHLPLLVDYGR